VRYRLGLGAAVGLLVTVTVAAVAWATYVNTRAAILELTRDRIGELLVQTGARVQGHMLAAVPAVELSRMLARDALLPDDRAALARHFVLVLRANPTFSWVSYSDEAGSFTGAYRTLDGILRVSETTLRAGKSELREHTVDDAGRWTPHLGQTDYGYDPRTDRFYGPARAAGRRVWVGPYVFFDEGVPGITCATPHLAPDGRLLGVFTVDFNLNFLSRFVAELKFGDHGRVVIFHPDGAIIAHPTLRVVEVTGRGAEGKLLTVASANDPVLRAFAAARAGAASSSGVAEISFEHGGERYVGAARTVPIDAGLTWVVGAYAPESDFMDALARNRRVALAVAAAALLLGVLLTLVLSRRISVPLTRLAAEMEEVGAFRLTRRPPQETIFKEVALMDQSLLRMKGSLRSFAYYVPTDLVRTMLASGQEATLQGHTRELTIYFSDIAGFTSMAETMTPDELVRAMSRYLDEMTRVIGECSGTVDKFIGDAIMAFWGAPAECPDHAARACESAVLCQQALARIRSSGETPWAKNLHARIGIATGAALVGNIGSPARFNYTVMGDTVNLASRLESLNKLYGTEMLVSDATYAAARDRVVGRPVDVVQVKGRHTGVKVYELLCLADGAGEDARDRAARAEDALDAYLAREFEAAARRFGAIVRAHPDDLASALLLERCRELLVAPPPADWSGVYVASHK
jgi:adenylate cyclase